MMLTKMKMIEIVWALRKNLVEEKYVTGVSYFNQSIRRPHGAQKFKRSNEAGWVKDVEAGWVKGVEAGW